MVFYFLLFFVFFGATLKITVLPIWELNSGEVDLHFFVFPIFENAKKIGFRQGRIFMFFNHFWCLLEAFWVSFGVLLESLASLWWPVLSFWSSLVCLSRPWALSATFCGAFGSPGLFLGLGDRSRTVFGSIFGLFGVIF